MSVLNRIKGQNDRHNFTLDETCFIYVKKEVEKCKVKDIAKALTTLTGTKRSAYTVSYKISWIRDKGDFNEIYSFYKETLTDDQDIYDRSDRIENK